MAIAAGVTEDVRALIKCSLCLSIFQQPKCLPCIHTFCQDCLQKYVDQKETSAELPCPLCRHIFLIPPQGLSSLPNNFFIQNLMELERKSGTEPEKMNVGVKCDLCLDESNADSPAALKFCLECNENLCEACIIHHEMKATKSHALILLRDKVEDAVRALKSSVRMCKIHSSEPLRAYCLKCDVCICTSCMLAEHNEHKYEKIKDAARKFTEYFNANSTKLSEALTHGYSCVKELMAAEEQVIKESSKNEQKIRERCDELRKILDGLEEELLSEAKNFREERVKEIKSKRDQKEFQNLQLETFIRYLGELKDKGSNYDIACSGKELSTRAEHLLKSSKEALTEERKMIHMEFLTSHEAIDVNFRRLVGELVSGEKRLVIVGVNKLGWSLQRKICHISLDKPVRINVINSTPAAINVESTACVVSNVLYAVGIGDAYNELWKWSASRDKWTRCACLPSGRRRHCVTSVSDKIYVFGGWIDAWNRTLDSILCYDISTNKWTEAGKLFHAVDSSACVTYKQCVYVFGGMDKDDKVVSHVQIYDTITGKVALGSNPILDACYLMRAVLWRSKALLVGEFTCYMYGFDSNTWLERKKFKTDAKHFGLSVDDNTLYISGGGTNSDDDVWTLRDDVRSLSVNDFISDNKEAEWKHHATLHTRAFIHVYSVKPLLVNSAHKVSRVDGSNYVTHTV